MDNDRGNSALRLYLQSKFSPLSATQQTDHHVAAEVINHMFEDFKVNTKNEKDLFLFKYDQTLCERWDLDFVNECRGIVLRRTSTEWIVESRPFDKFFNQNEGESPVKDDPQFNAICKTFSFVEKADGTCIQLWYDDERAAQLPEERKYRAWRVSTLGTITPQSWVTCLFWGLLTNLHTETNANDNTPSPDFSESKHNQRSDSSAKKVRQYKYLQLDRSIKALEAQQKDGTITEDDKIKLEKMITERKSLVSSVSQSLVQSAEQTNAIADEDSDNETQEGPIFKSKKDVEFEDSKPVFEIEEYFISKSETLPSKLKQLNPHMTYLFELCCQQNQVVTQYEQDKLFLIGARNILTGTHCTRPELDQLAEMLLVERPRFFSFTDLGITSLKQAKEFVEQQAKEVIYGKNPEGFVIYHNDMPLCKLKNKSYTEKHGIVTGDLLYVRNVVIDRFFEDTLDDVIDVVTQPAIRAFLKELKLKVQRIMHELDLIREHEILPVVCQSLELYVEKKNFVPFVQKTVAKEWQPFFLMHHKQVLDLDLKSVSPFMLPWIKKCYFKFKGYWKSSAIAELAQKEMIINGQVTESEPLAFKFASLTLNE